MVFPIPLHKTLKTVVIDQRSTLQQLTDISLAWEEGRERVREMTILQTLKLMVVQCAAGRSNAGQSFQLRRPRRLAKKVHVLCRFRGLLRRGDCSGARRPFSEESRGLLKQRLADLFASPQTAEDEVGGSSFGNGRRALELVARRSGGGAGGGWRIGSAVGLRCRLLRRAWRPVLVAIPESD